MKGQDHDWGAAAIEQNRQWMMRYLVSCTGNRATAEDVCQDTFRIAYEKRSSFVPGTNFGGWLRGIARNRLKRYYAQSKRKPFLPEAGMDALDSAAQNAESEHLDQEWQGRRMAALEDCLKLLRKIARRVLHLKYSEKKSGKAIARILEIEPQKVNWTAFSARKTLFACIETKVKT